GRDLHRTRQGCARHPPRGAAAGGDPQLHQSILRSETMVHRRALFPALGALVISTAISAQPAHPLPSSNDGAAKKSITDSVARVTTPGGADFVPVAERIATFDNDGTLWAEQPAYFQLLFAIDRVKALAPQHPEWKTKQPYKAILDGNM